MNDYDEIVRGLRNQIENLHDTINCLQETIDELEPEEAVEEEDEETLTAASEATSTVPVKLERSLSKTYRRSSVPKGTPKRHHQFSRKSSPQSHKHNTFLGVHDSGNREIHEGDTVQFLSSGRFASRTGIAYKVDGKLSRVTARDRQKNCITRAPENLKVTKISPKRSKRSERL